jgi:hypothetical protein
MSEDHRFTDAVGNVITGKVAALSAWQVFFEMFPDYLNQPRDYWMWASEVAMAGETRCSDLRLEGPALWRAQVCGGLIVEWQVYVDMPSARQQLGLN